MEINCIHAFKKRGQHKKRKIQTNGRGFVKNRVDIDKRPATVNEKVRLGDWEFDTVIGKNHKEALLTINDRVAGLVWIRLLSGKDASPLTKAASMLWNLLESKYIQ